MTAPPPSHTFRPELYRILGVPSSASQDEVRNAYRQLALAHHPDKQQSDDNINAFQTIAEAYRVLGDAQTRASYDQWLSTFRATSEPHMTIDLDDMVAHALPPPSQEQGQEQDDGEPEIAKWTYACRCGGEFIVEVADLEQGIEVFPCSGCTLRARVVYFAV
ncbi:DnaJ domain-containing protein [Blastocladiella britannica]|nr:DnaJ domain-containing protein [Blastocladiella britannica]